MPVTVENHHPTLRVGRRWLAVHLRAMLRDAGRARAWVDVSLVGDAQMRALNLRHRGVDAVTDVLAFALEEAGPSPDPVEILGDVVVSLDTALRQARALRRELVAAGQADPRWRLREETAFLATHGLLHLLGWDHGTPEEARRMRAEERRVFRPLSPVDAHALDRRAHALDAG